jgi:hypothetical protein
MVKKNKHRLRNQKRALIFLQYHLDLLEWKQKKLKLGAIVFEIKEFQFAGITFWEEIEIKFIRQDTTEEDDRKLETLLKKLGWQWDARNIIAFVVVATAAFLYSIAFLKTQYYFYFPTLAYRSQHYDFILRCGFENAYLVNSIGFFQNFFALNFWLVDVLTDFCIHFNIIF